MADERNLIDYVPPYYADLKESAEILAVDGAEVNRLHGAIDEFTQQLTVSTATWGLAEWERILAITPLATDSDEERRARIVGKIRGAAPATILNVMSFINAHGRGKITEFPRQQMVELEISAESRFNFNAIIGDIATYIPAHLAYRIATLSRNKPCRATVSYCGGDVTIYPYRARSAENSTSSTQKTVLYGGQELTIYPKEDE